MKKEDILLLIQQGLNYILNVEGRRRYFELAIEKNIGSKPIKIISGFRRSGKSHLVQSLAKTLLNNKVFEKDNILYLNFEEYELRKISSPQKLNEIFEIFSSNSNPSKRSLIIFDEIQLVKDWDKFIRTIYERNQKNKLEIILTGSNSELLSSELGSNLAGRFIEFKILPFSFKEYLDFNGININTEKDFLTYSQEIRSGFYKYMSNGGLPETFSISDDKARFTYLNGILSKVILDDIINRFSIRNSELIERILEFLLVNIGNQISLSKITNHLKSQGYKIDINTLYKYISLFPKTFSLFELGRFDWKSARIFDRTKKFYAIDLGLTHIYSSMVSNFSKKLENFIFLELLHKDSDFNIHYVNDNHGEIDFIYRRHRSQEAFTKIQVSQTLEETNFNRELRVFTKLDKHLKSGDNFLITLDDREETLVYEGLRIKKLNAIKWALGISE